MGWPSPATSRRPISVAPKIATITIAINRQRDQILRAENPSDTGCRDSSDEFAARVDIIASAKDCITTTAAR